LHLYYVMIFVYYSLHLRFADGADGAAESRILIATRARLQACLYGHQLFLHRSPVITGRTSSATNAHGARLVL